MTIQFHHFALYFPPSFHTAPSGNLGLEKFHTVNLRKNHNWPFLEPPLPLHPRLLGVNSGKHIEQFFDQKKITLGMVWFLFVVNTPPM